MPVLGTKLHVPSPRRDLVPRPRLTDHLQASASSMPRLVLISAPAGFGKTTLLTQWLASDVPGGTRRVAWLSLDAEDAEPGRFLTHLVAALRTTDAQVGTEAQALVDGDRGQVAEPVLVSLINDLATLPGQTVLALDDYHVIDAPAVHQAVTFLLDHLPPQVGLAVTTRADPPLPLARLRSRGELLELRAADLRFTGDEAEAFLNQAMGLQLTPEHVTALETRTEGWATGLQLAALSARTHRGRAASGDGRSSVSGIDEFVAAFTGSHRFVLDYLVEEVLDGQPADVRAFLLDTSVLDQLTGSLCDALTGQDDGRRTLDVLERANLFVVPLDDERQWYRYHHLFADALRARLHSAQPDRTPELHRRASTWYASHDLVPDAVRHALAAGDFQRAAYLMEQALPQLRRARQDSLLLSWMQSLPQSVVQRRPVLGILAGWSRLMSGDLDAAESRFDDAEAALAAGAHDPELAELWADTEDLRTAPATIAVYRASLAQARGDVAGTVRHARQALDLARPEDHLIRGAGGGFLGLAAWAGGDVRQALSTFADAVGSLRAAGNLVDALDSTVVLADMWVAAGRPGSARRLYEQALRTATGAGEPYPRATADLHVGLAELDRELDDLPSAQAHLERAQVLGRRTSITENQHRWFVAMAQVRAAARDVDAALHLLDQGETLYRRGFYPEVRPIAAMTARLQLARGDLVPVAEWAHERGVGIDDNPDYLHEFEHLTLVRLLLAQHHAGRHSDLAGGSSPVTAALGLLDRLHAAAEEAAREGSLVEIRALRALAHHADGDLPRAIAALERCFAETPEPENHVRLYLDEGVPMLALLRHAVDAESAGAVIRDWARRLLARTRAGEGAQPQQGPVDALSQRELEVIRLLDSELTGPQIARELYVTLNTLRTHTKRIFTKLDVTTRAAAVRRAQERGLL